MRLLNLFAFYGTRLIKEVKLNLKMVLLSKLLNCIIHFKSCRSMDMRQ